VEDFNKEFGATTFDLKRYDPHNGIIVLDLESPKTKKSLAKLAHEIIIEAKNVMNLK
jgi:hypothetical protein